MPIDPAPAELPHLNPNFSGYALGLGVRDYRGHNLLQHTGGLPGYVSKVAMIPDLRLGVIVLTNQESGLAFNAITYRLLDYYLGAKAPDYVGIFTRAEAKGRSEVAESERTAAASRDSTSGPSLQISRYAQTYRDDWYGDITIAMENGALVMRFSHTPSLVGDLIHWQFDTFLVRWRDRELRVDAFVTFDLNPDGSIAQVRMAPASPTVDFSFDFQDLLLRPVAP